MSERQDDYLIPSVYSQTFKIIYWFPNTLWWWAMFFPCHYKLQNFKMYLIYFTSSLVITLSLHELVGALESWLPSLFDKTIDLTSAGTPRQPDPWLFRRGEYWSVQSWTDQDRRIHNPSSTKCDTQPSLSYSSLTNAFNSQPMASLFVSIFVMLVCMFSGCSSLHGLASNKCQNQKAWLQHLVQTI